MGNFLHKSTTYDLKLISSDSDEFPVHKAILVARCEYFKRMLSSNFNESVSDIIEVEMSSPTLKVNFQEIFSYSKKM